jgi:plastocyanin
MKEKAAVIAVAMVLLAGCGGNSAGTEAPSTTVSGVGKVTTDAQGVQEITLKTQDDYVFTPDHFTVAPGEVRLRVVNTGRETTHNFRFTPNAGPATIEKDIPLLPPGDEKTIDFTVETPGKYPFECSFHVQLGQVGTMTVSG